MRTAILYAVVTLTLSCGPTTPTSRPVPHPVSVSPERLVEDYRGASASSWVGRVVRIDLPAGSYSVTPTSVEWCYVTPGEPAVVFAGVYVEGTKSDLSLTGVCTPLILDTPHRPLRGPGVKGIILIHVSQVVIRPKS